VPSRFMFRQVYAGDLGIFLRDGEIRAKNHASPQACHQTSYPEIVNRRGTAEFPMPCGGVVNDYVPFYFSPITAFTYTIHTEKNVKLRSPTGQDLGFALDIDRIFFVCRVDDMRSGELNFCFSNSALNSLAPLPSIEVDLDKLESHICWRLFDDVPTKAKIAEIGYDGVCRYFHNSDQNPDWHSRKQVRMAEFLVRGTLPLSKVCCIVAKTDEVRDRLQRIMDASDWNIPILSKPGCYF